MKPTQQTIGQWCMSEDECIAEGIDFASYELGVGDAAKAYDLNSPFVREWQGLTDEEAFAAFGFHLWPETFLANAAQELKDTHEEAKKEVLSKVRAIEAKLKGKNGY